MAKEKENDNSALVRIGQESRLTPKQLKAVEGLLSATPYTPMETIAKEAGICPETLSKWKNHHERFQTALRKAANLKLGSRWMEIIDAGITHAIKGNVKWAMWLAELAGYYNPRLNIQHSGEVQVKSLIELIDSVTSNGHKEAWKERLSETRN